MPDHVPMPAKRRRLTVLDPEAERFYFRSHGVDDDGRVIPMDGEPSVPDGDALARARREDLHRNMIAAVMEGRV